MRITIDLSSESAGIREEAWKELTTAEKKAYIKKHPGSKYGKTGNQAKHGSAKGKSTKVQRKIGRKAVTSHFVWAKARTPNDVKKAIKDVSRKANVSGIKVVGKIEEDDNTGYSCDISAPSSEDMKKFKAAYSKA